MRTQEANDPLEELARENTVAQGLVERLGAIGLDLRGGAEVAPGEVAEGLRLLTQYGSVHGRRFDRDLEPEARVVAMPTCHGHLDAIVRDRASRSERIGRTEAALDAYAHGEPGARDRLASEIERLTQQEYEGLVHEGDYPLSCLLTALPDEAAKRVRSAFDATSPELGDLERRVERFLGESPRAPGRGFAVRCAAPGCPATGTAESFPAADGAFALRPPGGWESRAGSPHSPRAGHVAIDVDFLCPAHREPARRASRTGASPGPGRVPPSEEACACCDPIEGTGA